MVVAQLAKWLLPTKEVRKSNPVIGIFLYRTFVFCQLFGEEKSKEKEALNGPFKKYIIISLYFLSQFNGKLYISLHENGIRTHDHSTFKYDPAVRLYHLPARVLAFSTFWVLYFELEAATNHYRGIIWQHCCMP